MKKFMMALAATAAISFGVSAADIPSFPGGKDAMDKFIAQTLQYPASAKTNGVEGIVNVKFTVNPDGTIGAIKIVRMIDPDLEQEAIRIIKKMPAWIPADKDGTPVAADATVSIPFSLE